MSHDYPVIAAVFIALCFVCLCSCSKVSAVNKADKKEAKLRESARFMQTYYIEETQHKKKQAFSQWLERMDIAQKVSQLFLINVEGNGIFSPVETVKDVYNLSSSKPSGDVDMNTPLIPGGCIFFSYNIADTPEKIMRYIDSFRIYCTKHSVVPPFISVDQEGGDVTRLRSINSTLPSAARVSDCLSPDVAYKLYKAQGEQLCALGFDINFAPVSEPKKKSNEIFLGTRSYGDAKKTAAFASAAVKGYEDSGIETVIKHFPGNTNADPHSKLPKLLWQEKEIEETVSVFSDVLKARHSGILMSHACVLGYDEDTPACLSSYWGTDVLRGRMGYNGIIFSDDIFMDALQKNGFPPKKAVIMALEAGVDCIMISEKKFAVFAAMLLDASAKDKEIAKKIQKASERILLWKLQHGILTLQADSKGIWKVVYSDVLPIKDRLQQFTKAKERGTLIWSTYGAP